MTIPVMMSQSGLLTLLGMGVVFSFLIILVVFMKVVELLVKALGLDKEESILQTNSVSTNEQDSTIIAVIAAALKENQD